MKLISLGGDPPPILPGGWGRDLGVERHVIQGQIVAVGANKNAVAEYLIARGVPAHTAQRLCRDGRIIRGSRGLGNTWLDVHEAGVMPFDEPGVYAGPLSMVKGSQVGRLADDGTLTILGRFHYDSRPAHNGRGLYFVREDDRPTRKEG